VETLNAFCAGCIFYVTKVLATQGFAILLGFWAKRTMICRTMFRMFSLLSYFIPYLRVPGKVGPWMLAEKYVLLCVYKIYLFAT
jgi:hypothetical protein